MIYTELSTDFQPTKHFYRLKNKYWFSDAWHQGLNMTKVNLVTILVPKAIYQG